MNVGILAIALRQTVESGVFNSGPGVPGHALRVPLIVPTAHDITLHPLPLPFSSDVPGTLANSHIERMTDSKFFEEGEWEGVYTTSNRGSEEISFDDPMRAST